MIAGKMTGVTTTGARKIAMLLLAGSLCVAASAQTGQPEAAGAQVRKLGAVQSITGSVLVLKQDSGPDVKVTLPEGVRILRLAPGQTDLKSATPMALTEVQVADRMLVRGRPGDNESIVATTIVVMKQADVAQKQQHDRDDWQKRGAGGIVSAIDAASGTITLAVTPTLNIAVKTSGATAFLRYAPTSVKYSDAQKGAFSQILAGDQLRTRGARSSDGKEIVAEEVISGTFRNIAGTITAIDAAGGTITVKDILAKKSVVVQINADSQMRKLAAPMAQRLASLLKGGAPGGSPAPAVAGGPPSASPRPGTPPDFQQVLGRIPTVKLADFQKEDAVMIVATQGAAGSEVLAITLLGGVEPILTASPNGSGAAALFSGWNLSAPSGDAGPQ
ncbi:MAG TPA: hypothetical protein VNW97_18095 [Candidatus Saccharimonadales bacterium]|jgi:hypothetical protein|nr:hypothetical protein [Candidatus Saccharimonadales bacterium]